MKQTIEVDDATLRAVEFVLAQAAHDREVTAKLHRTRGERHPDLGPPPEPPPVPSFAEALAQAARIGVRSLADRAVAWHQRADVPPRGMDDRFYMQPPPRRAIHGCGGEPVDELAPGAGLDLVAVASA